VRLALALALTLALALPGCAKPATCGTTATFPSADGSPVSLVHGFDPSLNCDDHLVAKGAGRLDVTLENFYRSRCPGPIAALDVVAPNGTVVVHLETKQLPTFDCVYTANATLDPGTYTLRYAGGSLNAATGKAWLASLVKATST
jgi:hypothetical protein